MTCLADPIMGARSQCRPATACWHPPQCSASQAVPSLTCACMPCRKLVATFLEANGRGYWDASPEAIDKLRQLYTDVEDKIEGV